MRVWILDDRKFPTGYANGGFERHPELAKRYLAERHVDIMGPCHDSAMLVENFYGDNRLLAVLAVLMFTGAEPQRELLALYCTSYGAVITYFFTRKRESDGNT